METMGKKWVFGIGLYLILKGVLNLILGFSVSNIIMLIVGVGCAGTDAESCAVHQLHCRRFPGDHVSDPHRRKPQQSGQPVDLPPGGSAGSGRCCCAGVREECQGVFWQITAGNRKSQRQNGEYFSWFSSFGSQCLSNFFYRTADGR